MGGFKKSNTTTTPTTKGGFQPKQSNLDTSRPPQSGSGLPKIVDAPQPSSIARMHVDNNARLSVSLSFKGIIVSQASQYDKEKMDISLTRTLDVDAGETIDSFKAKLDGLDDFEMILAEKCKSKLLDKVQEVKQQAIAARQKQG